MADESLDNLRLSLMQDVLPVGLAMIKRVKKGGVSKLVEAFTKGTDPLGKLKEEGDPAAKSLRDRLDEVRPGFGNPVVPVTVEVDNQSKQFSDVDSDDALRELLGRIQERLGTLERHLSKDSSFVPNDDLNKD